MRGYRKFAVAALALSGGILIAMTQPADVVGAYGVLASAIMVAYMGANAVQDSKWGRDVPNR